MTLKQRLEEVLEGISPKQFHIRLGKHADLLEELDRLLVLTQFSKAASHDMILV